MHSIIACEVFRAELELLIREFRFSYDVHFLPQGLHDDPDRLRVRLQEKIDHLESAAQPPEKILLFYGFCGRGLSGVSAQQATLILPRTHDCIPLLLGMSQEKKERVFKDNKTFWMSPGWLKYSQLPFVANKEKRYSEYKEKFDEDSAKYLIDLESTWLSEYERATLICWDGWQVFSPSLKDDGKFIADDARLSYSEAEGSGQYMLSLLQGGNNRKLFFHIPPRHTVNLTASGGFSAEPFKGRDRML